MKKFAYLGICLMGLALASCDGYEQPNPPYATNPGQNAIATDGLTLTPTEAVATDGQLNVIDMEKEWGQMIPLANIVIDPEQFNSEFDQFGGYIQLSPAADFADTQDLGCTIADNQISVLANDLDAAYKAIFGAVPQTKELYARFSLNVSSATTDNVHLGGQGYFYGPLTLQVKPLTFAHLYTPGKANGWSPAESQQLQTTNFVNYFGYAHLNEEFKFTTAPNWDSINLGSTGEAGTLSNDSGAGNLSVGADGLYWCQVNLSELTYSVYHVAHLGLVGGFNGWGNDLELTPSDDYLTWTGTLNLEEDTTLKLRANYDWTVNLGGSLTDLQQGAGDIPVAAGNYTVTVKLGSYPYTMTLE